MSIELKPCPFCGSLPMMSSYTYSTLGGGYVQFKVECENDNCPAQPTVDWHYWSEAEAAEAWNTRAERTCHDVGKGWMWRCSECRCRLDIDRDFLPTMWVDNVASVPRYCPNCGAKVVE